MLVLEEVKCPHCGAKVPCFSGGFINKPATKAHCPICNKTFPVNDSFLDRLKGIIRGWGVIRL